MQPIEPFQPPPPGVFLASNVNSGKVTQICNIILIVVLVIGSVAAVILAVFAIMGWIQRETPQEVTTLNPRDGSLCSRKELMNNAKCDAAIRYDFDCLYDFPDCNASIIMEKKCARIKQASWFDCKTAKYLKEKYPDCNLIIDNCPNSTTTVTSTSEPSTAKSSSSTANSSSTSTSSTLSTAIVTTTLTTEDSLTTINYTFETILSTTTTTTQIYSPTPPPYSEYCPSKFWALLVNGKCDRETNFDMCNYDNGECCTYRNTYEPCLETNYGAKVEKCPNKIKTLINNGICEDAANFEACSFDDEDCCKNTTKFGIPYCTDCLCFAKNGTKWIVKNELSRPTDWGLVKVDNHHYIPSNYVNNSYCEDSFNTAQFGYDGGDCCLPTTIKNLISNYTCKDCIRHDECLLMFHTF